MATTPTDHTSTLLRMTETLGRVDARTASMETQAANDRLENREAHKKLGERIDALEGRVSPLEDSLQDTRTTAKNLKLAVTGVGGALAFITAISGAEVREFIGHLF